MAQPAPADARISCPVCRAPVHPIAGRCKHCKADLVRVRGGTTGAGETPVSIPVMGPGGAPAAAPLPLPGGRNGAMPALAAGAASPPALPAAAPLPALGAGSAPVIASPADPSPGPLGSPDGAPTGSLAGATHEAPRRARSWTRHGPIVVALVAGVAILGSLVVLLVGDLGGASKPKKLSPLGPAPDRMHTDLDLPAPPSPTPRAPAAPTPPPSPGAPAAPAPPTGPTDPTDPMDPSAPIDPFDPGAATGPGASADPQPPVRGASGVPRVSTVTEFLAAAIDAGCERLLACTSSSDDAQSMCRQARSMRDSTAATLDLSCTRFDASAANRCLAAIARMPCPDGLDLAELTRLATAVPACTRICG